MLVLDGVLVLAPSTLYVHGTGLPIMQQGTCHVSMLRVCATWKVSLRRLIWHVTGPYLLFHVSFANGVPKVDGSEILTFFRLACDS